MTDLTLTAFEDYDTKYHFLFAYPFLFKILCGLFQDVNNNNTCTYIFVVDLNQVPFTIVKMKYVYYFRYCNAPPPPPRPSRLVFTL